MCSASCPVTAVKEQSNNAVLKETLFESSGTFDSGNGDSDRHSCNLIVKGLFVTCTGFPPFGSAGCRGFVPHLSRLNIRWFERLSAATSFYAAFRPLFRLGGEWPAGYTFRAIDGSVAVAPKKKGV
jgi:hypothetical protein